MKPIPAWTRLVKTGCLLALATSALANDFTVTSTADTGAATPGTLRWAMTQSNAASGTNQILFTVPDSSSILSVSELPAITNNVVINATPTSGTAPDELTVGKSAVLDTYDILTITGSDCTLQNIVFKDGDINVGAGSNLILNFTDDATFSDIIKGAGNLIKRGTGDVTLDGMNTWTGTCTVEEGRLRVNTSSLPGDAAVQSSARLAFIDAGGGPETYSGTITGEGVLVKEDSHDLTLDGTISHTGGTEVEGGRLIVNPSSFASRTTVSSGATLQLSSDSASTVNYSSIIAGAGMLEKAGTATVSLSGANSFTGGINILAGQLQGPVASLPGNIAIAAGSVLTFTEDGTATYGDIISGDGSVVIDGSGTTIFSTLHTYTGGTTLSNGTLQSDTQLVGNVSIAAGSTLSGLGGVAGNVLSSGVVAPGPGSGTASVGGDLTLEASGGLNVVIKADGTNSAVNVAGLTTIKGATLSVTPEPGDYSTPITYDVLLATGGFDATDNAFGTVEDTLAFINVTAETVLGDGVVRLSAEQNLSALSDFAQTPNQLAIANATEQLCEVDGVDDIDTICNNIAILTEDGVSSALSSLNPESLGSLLHARMIGSMRSCERISARYGHVGPSHPEARYRQRSGLSWPEGRPTANWVEGFWVEDCLLSSAGHPDDQHSRAVGLLGGVDILNLGRSGDRSLMWTLGATAGYTYSSVCYNSSRSELYSHGLTGGLYTAMQYKGFYAGLTGQTGYHFMCSTRDVRFSDLAREGEASFHGYEGVLCGETGWRVELGDFLRIQPSGALYWGNFRQQGLREKGAEGLNIALQKVNLSQLHGNMRVRISAEIDGAGFASQEPELYFGATWLLKNSSSSLQGRYSEAPEGSADFEVSRQSGDKAAYIYGVSWTFLENGLAMYRFCYDGLICKRERRHAVTASYIHSF